MIIQEPITIDASKLSNTTKFLLSTGEIANATKIDTCDCSVYIENHGWRYLCWISGYWYMIAKGYPLRYVIMLKNYIFSRKIEIRIINDNI
jgi:hypothetical protein